MSTEQKPEPLPALAVAAGSPLWAVSVVMIRHKPDGKMNIMNQLHRVKAANKDEATGCAIRTSMTELPEHSVHCVTALEFQSLENKADIDSHNP